MRVATAGTRAVISIAVLSAGCGAMSFLGRATTREDLQGRVSKAQVVLVGKLVKLDERGATGEEPDVADGRLYTRLVWYDVATLEVIEVLKGACDTGTVRVKFLSYDQTQYPPNDKADVRMFSSHDIWNPGIWLIDIDRHVEPAFTIEPGNYEPMMRLEDVKTALKAAKTSAAKRGGGE